MRSVFLMLFYFIFSTCSFGQINQFGFDTEIMPTFPGGEVELYKFIKDKRIYTESAREVCAEGKVIIRFAISADGSINDAIVAKGIHSDCDSIALDIVRSMPKWNTKGVKREFVYYTLPITFPYDVRLGRKTYWAPDLLPSFPGGEQVLLRFIVENLRYTEPEMSCQGKVIIRFIVTKEGKIKSSELIRSLSGALDEEALRVLNLMPDWIPAKYNGEDVDAYFTLPIIFKLKSD